MEAPPVPPPPDGLGLTPGGFAEPARELPPPPQPEQTNIKAVTAAMDNCSTRCLPPRVVGQRHSVFRHFARKRLARRSPGVRQRPSWVAGLRPNKHPIHG